MIRTKLLSIGALLAIALCSLAFALDHDPEWRKVGPVRIPGEFPQPAGQKGGWRLVFNDEFEGNVLDRTKWTDKSSAASDDGHGNHGNKQLEWNQAANCKVSGGELTMTARRERIMSGSGAQYDWTSCLLSSGPSFSFRYGYVEERAIVPSAVGFWPAFWTWQASGINRQIETDIYEIYTSDAPDLHLTQHSGDKGHCRWRAPFDPSADWHTYGAAIESTGTTWYVDGVKVCHTIETSDGDTNIISNLAVSAANPPAYGIVIGVKRVDYVRAWQRL